MTTLTHRAIAQLVDAKLDKNQFIRVTAYKKDGTLRTFNCGPMPSAVRVDLEAKTIAGTKRIVVLSPTQRRVWDYKACNFRIMDLNSIVSVKSGKEFKVEA